MNKKKLIISSSFANIFEWYDYALYGQLNSIIGSHFLQTSDPALARIEAFSIFAAGYLMRPLGGIAFGVIGDKFGRKFALYLSVLLMALPTTIIGLLPGYNQIGIFAPIILALLRMIQGLSMGGALTGSVSFLIEHTSHNKRGMFGSIAMASISIGMLLGSFVIYMVKSHLGPEAFADWGWRVPFLFGIFIFVAALYIKNYTSETPVFKNAKQNGDLVESPLRTTLRNYKKDLFLSIFINSTGSIIFYFQAIYIIDFLKFDRGFPEANVDLLLNISYLVTAIFALISGWLSDKIGRRFFYNLLLVVIAISSSTVLDILETGDFEVIAPMQIIFAMFAGCYIGPEPALQAEFYPSHVRNTALSIAYNLATSLFGGTTPLIISCIVLWTGSIKSASLYIVFCCMMSALSLFFYKNRSKTEQLSYA